MVDEIARVEVGGELISAVVYVDGFREWKCVGVCVWWIGVYVVFEM